MLSEMPAQKHGLELKAKLNKLYEFNKPNYGQSVLAKFDAKFSKLIPAPPAAKVAKSLPSTSPSLSKSPLQTGKYS